MNLDQLPTNSTIPATIKVDPAVVVQLLEVSEGLPWPWRLIVVVGAPLSVWILFARMLVMALLLIEGFITSKRRRAGTQPSSLVHAISDGLELAWGWLRRIVFLPLLASAAVAALVFLGSLVGIGIAEELEFRMVDTADRALRAE